MLEEEKRLFVKSVTSSQNHSRFLHKWFSEKEDIYIYIFFLNPLQKFNI